MNTKTEQKKAITGDATVRIRTKHDWKNTLLGRRRRACAAESARLCLLYSLFYRREPGGSEKETPRIDYIAEHARRLQVEIIHIHMRYIVCNLSLFTARQVCVGALQLHNLTARIINYQTMIYGCDANYPKL